MPSYQMDEDLFQDNLQRWIRTNPKKAVFLPYVEASHMQFCQTENEELNLYREKNGVKEYFHNKQSAMKEANDWFKSLNLDHIDVIYVYGVGLGYYYQAARGWLKKNSKRNIIFLEDDIEVMKRFLQTSQAVSLLEDPQAQLHYFEDLKDTEGVFEGLYWDFVMTQMVVTSLNMYAEKKKEHTENLKHKIIYDAAIKNALVEEYLKYGISFFRNFYANLLCLSGSYRGCAQFKKYENIPAIICGAGPSLNRNIDQIPQYLDKAIVFGGGSALNALSSRGILPHFGIGIDPNPTQQFRLSTNKAYEVPLFYRNRLHYEAFRLIHGPRLYIHGSGGYDIADWFDEQFDLQGEWIDEGHNVVNFGLELAYRMGLNPIILVGVDLAFTEMQTYAKGIIDDTAVKKKEIMDTKDFDTNAILKNDIYGKPIYTLWKWIAEADWIADFAKEHKDVEIINCTEGGLGMPGIKNMSLKEAQEKAFHRSYDLRSRIACEIAESEMPEITQEKVFEKVNKMLDSLKNCCQLIEVLIDDTKSLIKKLKEDQQVPDMMQSGKAALAEIDLSEEIGYEYLLDLFNNIYSRILNKELHQTLSLVDQTPDWQVQAKKAEINLKRLVYLRDVAMTNAKILDEAIQDRKEFLLKSS